jgi:hypothetical protein
MPLFHGSFNVWAQTVAVHPAEAGDTLFGAVNAGVVTSSR